MAMPVGFFDVFALSLVNEKDRLLVLCSYPVIYDVEEQIQSANQSLGSRSSLCSRVSLSCFAPFIPLSFSLAALHCCHGRGNSFSRATATATTRRESDIRSSSNRPPRAPSPSQPPRPKTSRPTPKSLPSTLILP